MRRKSNSPEITIIGCGTPTPLPDRFGSSYVIDIGGEKLLFDCGPATTWKLIKAGISPTEINSVFFTHHHFDHDADFPTFILTRWDQIVPKDRLLKVYGPTMTEEFTRGIIDEDTIERFKCKIICGCANNQLEDKLAGYAMLVKKILLAPDYLVNSGGVINSAAELSGDYDEFDVAIAIDGIFERLMEIYEISRAESIPTNIVANRLAEERLAKGK